MIRSSQTRSWDGKFTFRNFSLTEQGVIVCLLLLFVRINVFRPNIDTNDNKQLFWFWHKNILVFKKKSLYRFFCILTSIFRTFIRKRDVSHLTVGKHYFHTLPFDWLYLLLSISWKLRRRILTLTNNSGITLI